ncbi:MAG: DUF4242 domain-containing protein [Balneolaceae bacterium]|nr:DUF4242 domain-containing protein [Balneolaceae bacterium]
MPLYIDIHIFSHISIDEVKEAHIADLAVQERYNVQYHQFWVNQHAGTVFCLIEGPDAEACERVHQEAHGNIACNIVEVEPGFYNQFMGENHQLDDGIVLNEDNSMDLGYRFVLVVDIRGHTRAVSSQDVHQLILPVKAKKLVKNFIRQCQGKMVKVDTAGNIVAVFKKSGKAISCAVQLKRALQRERRNSEDSEWDILFKMGISGGQPLTKTEGFFENVIRTSQRLCLVAEYGEVLISESIRQMGKFDEDDGMEGDCRFVNTSEENFLNNLIETVENNISDNQFNVTELSRAIGISRPQLYRKITTIAGRPPSKFIRDLRMQEALRLIKQKQYNVTEVSLEVGYQNPSYFSKCFLKSAGFLLA